MRPLRRRSRSAVPRAGLVRLLLGAALLVGGLSCGLKTRDFFLPLTVPDIDPPVFAPIFPIPSLTGPLRFANVVYDVTDPAGTNGAPPSGVNPSTVTATLSPSGTALTGTALGTRYTWSTAQLTDGAYDFRYTAKDNAGNVGTAQRNLILKLTPPTIAITASPATLSSSSAASVPFTFTGTVMDPYLGPATATVSRAGADGQCFTADDIAWPVGTGLGQISQNSFAIGASYNFTATAYNGLPATPVTASYCWLFRAEDTTKDGSGAASPNVATRTFKADVTWSQPLPLTGSVSGKVMTQLGPVVGATVTASGRTSPTVADGGYKIDLLAPGSTTVLVSNLPVGVTCTPASKTATIVAGSDVVLDFLCLIVPPFSISFPIGGTWAHQVGFTYVCQAFATTPPQPNASFSGQLSQSFATANGDVSRSAVIGNGVVTGTTSATGTGTLLGSINTFGSYSWSLTIAGVTAAAPVTVVTAAAGTCIP